MIHNDNTVLLICLAIGIIGLVSLQVIAHIQKRTR